VTLLIYNLKWKLFLLITLVDFAELLTDFSYTNFTYMPKGCSLDALDRLRVHLNILVMLRTNSLSICNHSRARLVDSSRNRTCSKGYTHLMRSYVGLLKPRVSSLTPLKCTFNAEHFIRKLS